MVSDLGDGYAGKSTAEFQQGLDLIESHLRQKRPVVVGIDYAARKKGEWIKEGITDHYVVIVSKETRLIDGKEIEVYRYYDPITSSRKYGTHEDNYLILEDNKLAGVYKHHPQNPNLPYIVTQVREYKKP